MMDTVMMRQGRARQGRVGQDKAGRQADVDLRKGKNNQYGGGFFVDL